MTTDATVVGGGVVGSTVAAALRLRGLDVLLLDDRREGRGTWPSGGHLRPGWFRGLPRDQYLPAMDVLDRCWGMTAEPYTLVGSDRFETMHRVDTDLVTSYPYTPGTATRVAHPSSYPLVTLADGSSHRTRLLVVAAGAWCSELFPTVRTLAKTGVSYRVRGVLASGPFVDQWAPYKQVVAHQQTPDRVWVGDGTAILAKNWTADRQEASRVRCSEALLPKLAGRPLGRTVETRTGVRPYCRPLAETDPCLLARPFPRVWVATGAGKSGTIAAGWAAWRILEALDADRR